MMLSHQHGDHVGDRRHQRDVEGELGDQLAADGVAIEALGRRRRLQHAGAQVHHHALPDPGASIAAHEHADAAHQEDQHDRVRDPAHEHRVLVHEGPVQEGLGSSRKRNFGGGRDDHAQDRQGEHAPVGAHVAQQAGVELGAGHAGTLGVLGCRFNSKKPPSRFALLRSARPGARAVAVDRCRNRYYPKFTITCRSTV